MFIYIVQCHNSGICTHDSCEVFVSCNNDNKQYVKYKKLTICENVLQTKKLHENMLVLFLFLMQFEVPLLINITHFCVIWENKKPFGTRPQSITSSWYSSSVSDSSGCITL